LDAFLIFQGTESASEVSVVKTDGNNGAIASADPGDHSVERQGGSAVILDESEPTNEEKDAEFPRSKIGEVAREYLVGDVECREWIESRGFRVQRLGTPKVNGIECRDRGTTIVGLADAPHKALLFETVKCSKEALFCKASAEIETRAVSADDSLE
jgi:hypothetical protein